jgi:hypothetical protein
MINEAKFQGPQSIATREEKVKITNRLQFKVPNGRWYALNSESLRALVALDRACLALNPSVTEEELITLLIQISSIETSLIQAYRQPAPPPLPEAWKDPFGNALFNPWLASDLADSVVNMAREILVRQDPALAEMFKRLAADPYGTMAEIRAAELRRQAISKIKFDSKNYEANPFRDSSPTGDQKMAEFIATNSPLIVEIYRLEAFPASCSWATATKNRSACGAIIQCLRDSPLVGIDSDVVTVAGIFDGKIRTTERLAAEDAAKAAAQRARELSITSGPR